MFLVGLSVPLPYVIANFIHCYHFMSLLLDTCSIYYLAQHHIKPYIFPFLLSHFLYCIPLLHPGCGHPLRSCISVLCQVLYYTSFLRYPICYVFPVLYLYAVLYVFFMFVSSIPLSSWVPNWVDRLCLFFQSLVWLGIYLQC